MILLISGYLMTFDLGLAPSVIRYTAEYSTTGEWSRLTGTLKEITQVYIVLGILWIAGVPVGVDWIVDRTPAPRALAR